MAHRCPQCGAEYDATLFQFGIPFRCSCGAIVRPEHGEASAAEARRQAFRRKEEEIYRTFQRAADRIAYLIVSTDYPAVDIAIERRKLRELCQRLFPDRVGLYDMVYEARFERLWAQFREGEGEQG
ncbi:MAG: hypothetical protein GF330_04650 [Candidatus Eisenbacteria bacterium]|nr:hypothetical protein [Candidatus Eisenbacteria bacterium]